MLEPEEFTPEASAFREAAVPTKIVSLPIIKVSKLIPRFLASARKI